MLAKHNIDAGDFKRFMISDPHCLNALRQECRLFGRDNKVVHYSKSLLELL